MTHPTYDRLIAKGNWSGEILRLHERMSGYLVDGARFGAIPITTKTPSLNDTHLDKQPSEITTAARVFSRLGHEKVEFITVGSNGKRLERPDLDARLPDGAYIGVEVAGVSETAARKHDSAMNQIEVAIADLLDADPAFRKALGDTYFSLTLNGVGPNRAVQIASKKEAQSIAEEIERFIRSRSHASLVSDYFATFPAQYATLAGRGAQYHAEPAARPYFSVAEGATTIGRAHRLDEVIRVLDDHRASAKDYRPLPTWILLSLTDTMESSTGPSMRSKPRSRRLPRSFAAILSTPRHASSNSDPTVVRRRRRAATQHLRSAQLLEMRDPS